METRNMCNVENLKVSSEDLDILHRIASDYDVMIEDIAHQMIINGVKHSSFRLYADPASAIAQRRADDLFRGH